MELFYSNHTEGGVIVLDAEESAQCVKVLRHRNGDEISVIDGCGTLFRAVLEDADPRGARARITGSESNFGAHPYRLAMAVCPTKNIDRYEWFAEKATEIGVDVIAPVIGDHSERKVLKTERLERLVKAAAKQSLKGAVPTVLQPQSVRDFILSVPDDALKIICYCFDGNKRTIAELLSPAWPSAQRNHDRPWSYRLETGGVRGDRPSVPWGCRGIGCIPPEAGMSEAKFRWAEGPTGDSALPEIFILIGPEGDFSTEEAELALSRGWVPVTLGSSRLRTETAAIVAVTQVYSAF